MKILNNKLIKENKEEKPVNEALNGKFELETFFKMAKEIGIENFADLEKFLKNEAQPGEKEWDTMLRYRASLGNDFKIKEELEEGKEKKELTEDKETCILCGKHIDGYGNNPAPLADEGKCCDECNKTKVIPARMEALRGKKRMDEAVKDEEEDDIEECLHKHCHKEFKFDDEPYKAPFRGVEVEVEDKELEYDDEPSMDY